MGMKILSTDDLKDGDISRLFFRARSFGEYTGTLKKKSAMMMTAFFEPSTRTKLSFNVAALKMGIDVLHFDPPSSSLKKKESFEDTLLTLAALNIDLLVTRTFDALDASFIRSLPCAVINGGDGMHEHPTQALLDCFTLLQAWRSDNLVQKKILIVGDLVHSRVARSNLKLMQRLGADITLLCPPSLRLHDQPELATYESFEALPHSFDAVMVLRMQKERIGETIPMSDSAYFASFGMNKKRLESLGAQCLLMHPGPMNVGVEIDKEVAYGSKSLILAQVKNGVLIRAALIEHCLEEDYEQRISCSR